MFGLIGNILSGVAIFLAVGVAIFAVIKVVGALSRAKKKNDFKSEEITIQNTAKLAELASKNGLTAESAQEVAKIRAASSSPDKMKLFGDKSKEE